MKILHESFAPKKRDKIPLSQLKLSQQLRNLWISYCAVVPQGNTLTSYKIAHPGFMYKNWSFSDLSIHSGLGPLEGETEPCKGAKTTLG